MTHSTTDANLLAAFLDDGNPDAFALLARCHAHFVHAAARRLAPQDADDITQSVFLLLAQKKPRLTEKTLPPWLHKTTRYAALNANKLRRRRQHHEYQAGAAMLSQTPPAEILDEPTAHQSRALLDHALAKLPAADRAVLLLRHLEGKSLEQTAAALHISPAAASKRSTRALEKLRALLTRRGTPLSAAALAALLATESAHAAPPALLASLTTPTSSATALAHLTAKSLLGAKMKLAAALTTSTAAAALAAWALSAALAQSPPATAPAMAATSPAPTGDLLVVAYSLVLDAKTADRLRALSAPSPSQSNFFETRTAHMADIRKLLHDSALATSSLTWNSQVSEIPPARPLPWDGRWTLQELYSDAIRRPAGTALIGANFSDNFDAGTSSLQNNSARLSINFDKRSIWERLYAPTPASRPALENLPQFTVDASLHWSGTLADGEALLAIGRCTQIPGDELDLVALCETHRLPAAEATYLRACQDTARWLDPGPDTLRKQAQTALIWSYAARLPHAEERKVLAQWTRTLPGEVTVTLEAVGNGADSPYLWWDAAGNPLTLPRLNAAPADQFALLIHCQSPNTFDGQPAQMPHERYDDSNAYALPHGTTRATMYVADTPWTERPIAVGDSLTLPTGDTVQFKKVMATGNHLTLAILKGAAAPQTQITIAAVTKEGQRILPHNLDVYRAVFSLDDKTPQWTGRTENVPVKAADVDHWLLLTRPRNPARFENFALRPTVAPGEISMAPADLDKTHQLAAIDHRFADGTRDADRLDDLDELPRNPATPLGTLRLLVDAANTGNPQAVKPFLTGAPAAVDATARDLALTGSLHCRLEKKFGRIPLAQARADLSWNVALEESYLHQPIKLQDGGATAIGNGNERLVRSPATNHWQLDADALIPKNLPPAAINARLDHLEAAAKIADDAEAGKLTAPQAAALIIKTLNPQP